MSANHDDELDRLERELRRLAPEPAYEFLWALEASLSRPAPAPARAPAPRPSPGSWRVALAGGLTAALAGGLAATGGLSYAATSLGQLVRLAHRAAAPHRAPVVRHLSGGSDQYLPGYGFGDPNHNHAGPPGLTVETPAGVPVVNPPPLPVAPAPGGLAKVVATSINLDEQAHLWISVVDPRGTPLLLTQRSPRGGSTIGHVPLTGPQTKFIQYAVLVPRTIPIRLRVPQNLLRRGVIYRIRIVAVDPQGNKSRIFIPFRQS